VKDTSLRVPPGMDGTVIRRGACLRVTGSKKTRALWRSEKSELERVRKDLADQQRIWKTICSAGTRNDRGKIVEADLRSSNRERRSTSLSRRPAA